MHHLSASVPVSWSSKLGSGCNLGDTARWLFAARVRALPNGQQAQPHGPCRALNTTTFARNYKQGVVNDSATAWLGQGPDQQNRGAQHVAHNI